LIRLANIFENPDLYDRQNLRLVGQQITLDELAATFSDLFGKDVIYNPLTFQEVAALPFATAPAMAQMCNFLGDPRLLRHDPEATRKAMHPRKPQTFEDWLLTHSDSTAFSEVGLDYDAEEISFVTVFAATSLEGTSVVKGLLGDVRKTYRIRATTRHVDAPAARELKALDPDRVEVVYADFDDLESCKSAIAGGAQGAFLVTDFWHKSDRDLKMEERHVRNVIDTCESSGTMRHLVFSTKESAEDLSRHGFGRIATLNDATQFDAEARAAVYARTKILSVTYVLMPCYSEVFFERIEKHLGDNGRGNALVLTLPVDHVDAKFMCMSVEDLGPAVANIFDSYQVYAGREIGLVTDFVTVSEVRDMIEDVFMKDNGKHGTLKAEAVGTDEWVEAKDTYMKDLGQVCVVVL
jgi:NmrA-like family